MDACKAYPPTPFTGEGGREGGGGAHSQEGWSTGHCLSPMRVPMQLKKENLKVASILCNLFVSNILELNPLNGYVENLKILKIKKLYIFDKCTYSTDNTDCYK